jgi:serine/threonine protein kinase
VMSKSDKKHKKDKIEKKSSSKGPNAPKISASEIEKGKILGQGMFGTVYQGRCRGQDVAIKELKNFNADLKEDFIAEVEIMSQVLNPHIVLLLGACTEAGNWSMVTEFMSNGDLHHLLHESKRVVKLNKKIQFAIDICSGMSWLSGEDVKIIHRDLKPANVLIDAKWNCKIADFGLALLKSKGMLKGDDSGGGSPLWMSPEALLEEPTTVKTDVYSFGLVFWEMLTQKDLFPEYNDLELFTSDIAIKGVRPSLEGVDQILQDIIKRCWDKKIATRPTFQELIPILQNARVDINLPATLCPLANQLWKSKFLSQSKVPIDQFMKQLSLVLGRAENAIHKNCVQQLILKKSATDYKAMTTGKLAKLIKWFGPLKQGQGKEEQITILQKMEMIMKCPWFFGTLDSAESENILSHHANKEGTFLVRLNNGGGIPITQSAFTISRIEKGAMVHTRVYPSQKGDPGFYIKIDGATTKINGSICDFIVGLQQNKKEICGAVAEGHPFQSIFSMKARSQGAYQVNGNDIEDDPV